MGKQTTLTHKEKIQAQRTLLKVVQLLDTAEIPYHLEGGTLLGIVRDGRLLPWDHDLDISIPLSYASQFLQLRKALRKIGLRMSVRKSQKSFGPIKEGEVSIIKIKPIVGYYITAVFPRYADKVVVLDVFMKATDEQHTYWQAKNKVMRVDNTYYKGYDEVDFLGHKLKAPLNYEAYLTEKYGDWHIPIKEWSCDKDEGTIVG
jgi:lipopolysaccharide cholinephosphotransferase